MAIGIHSHRSAAEFEALRSRFRDANHRLVFVRLYLKELQDHRLDGPEHEAALQLTLAAERRAVEECERLRAALEETPHT